MDNEKLTNAEIGYIQKLVLADRARMDKEMDHAVCYGSDITLPDYNYNVNAMEKINAWYVGAYSELSSPPKPKPPENTLHKETDLK